MWALEVEKLVFIASFSNRCFEFAISSLCHSINFCFLVDREVDRRIASRNPESQRHRLSIELSLDRIGRGIVDDVCSEFAFDSKD